MSTVFPEGAGERQVTGAAFSAKRRNDETAKRRNGEIRRARENGESRIGRSVALCFRKEVARPGMGRLPGPRERIRGRPFGARLSDSPGSCFRPIHRAPCRTRRSGFPGGRKGIRGIRRGPAVAEAVARRPEGPRAGREVAYAAPRKRGRPPPRGAPAGATATRGAAAPRTAGGASAPAAAGGGQDSSLSAIRRARRNGSTLHSRIAVTTAPSMSSANCSASSGAPAWPASSIRPRT